MSDKKHPSEPPEGTEAKARGTQKKLDKEAQPPPKDAA